MDRIEKPDAPRILQVIPAIATAFGGPAIGSIALNRALVGLGANAVLVTAAYKDKSGRKLSDIEVRDILGGGTVARVSGPSWPFRLENSFGLLAEILRRTRTVDLVHIHGQYMLPSVYAYMAARFWRKPYGFQAHGSLEPYQRKVSPRRKAIYNALIGTSFLRCASYVMFASPSEAARANDVVSALQSVVRPLGSELAEPQNPEIPGLSDRLSRFPRSSRFLFLGRLASKKRPDLLLRAWASSGACQSGILIIAGPDGDLKREELVELAHQLDIDSSVIFLGTLEGAEKSWLYHQAGSFVFPSENENFGLTLGEAMLAGCHVITNPEVASSSFLVDSGSGHVVSPMDELSLGAAINSALLAERETGNSGAIAQGYARENLTWTPLASFLIEKALETGINGY